MRLALLIALTMTAFAANSLLTRAAIDGGHISPAGFAVLRVASGAVFLAALVVRQAGARRIGTALVPGGVVSLAVYMIGFTLAYITLDAGLGALILFGVVQITMFLQASFTNAKPTPRQMTGAGVAFAGLSLALWPDPGSPATLEGAILMVFAGIGWAAYTISGRSAVDPIAATSANFIGCLPLVAGLLFFLPFEATGYGIALGVICGALTSGLGYALWYRILPDLAAPVAATVQLSVPIIAILLGTVLLSEPLSARVILSAILVVGGIGLSVFYRPAATS